MLSLSLLVTGDGDKSACAAFKVLSLLSVSFGTQRVCLPWGRHGANSAVGCVLVPWWGITGVNPAPGAT